MDRSLVPPSLRNPPTMSFQRLAQDSMLFGPAHRHRPRRHSAQRPFVGDTLEAFATGYFEAAVTQALDGAAKTKGPIDIVALTGDIASKVTVDLLGFRPEDRELIRDCAIAVPTAGVDWTHTDRGKFAQMTARTDALFQLVDGFARGQRELSPEDRKPIVNALLAPAKEGRKELSHNEIVAAVALFVGASVDTLTRGISNGLFAILKQNNPHSLLRHVATADELMKASAVEELLRFDPPVQLVTRVATSRIALDDDHTIQRGERVLISLGAANHDPVAFSNPERLNLERFPTRADRGKVASFGDGPYVCMGIRWGRKLMEHTLVGLAERFPNMGLTLLQTIPRRHETASFSGPDKLWVNLGPATEIASEDSRQLKTARELA